MATLGIFSSRSARTMRKAISPRLAMRTLFIIDRHQEKTAGGCSRTGLDIAAWMEAGQHVICLKISFAHFEQHPDNVTDHVLQEAGPGDLICQCLTRAGES